MLDKALTELNTDKRNQMWGEIDKRVMQEAVIYPGVYSKSLLRAVEECHQHLRHRRIRRVRLSGDGSPEVAQMIICALSLSKGASTGSAHMIPAKPLASVGTARARVRLIRLSDHDHVREVTCSPTSCGGCCGRWCC